MRSGASAVSLPAYPKGTVPTTIKVQPTPIYETVLMFAVAWLLFRWAKRGMNGWCVFGWFLVLSGVERFLIEFIRRNPVWLFGLTAPQWESILGLIVGAALVARYRAVTTAPSPAVSGKARRR
jgi:phosphatidylglycerol:prolipoprotein diacylglycerol transferase